jgi:hypothetical protein
MENLMDFLSKKENQRMYIPVKINRQMVLHIEGRKEFDEIVKIASFSNIPLSTFMCIQTPEGENISETDISIHVSPFDFYAENINALLFKYTRAYDAGELFLLREKEMKNYIRKEFSQKSLKEIMDVFTIPGYYYKNSDKNLRLSLSEEKYDREEIGIVNIHEIIYRIIVKFPSL